MDRREIRVFVSSTFRDLQAERSYLLTHIFPKLRAECRARGIEFTEIDLRWGLTEEDASLGRIVRTCMEEIAHCRPYFIALIGDRYGWVPPLPEIQKDFQLLQSYPWIEDAVIGGSSLVELEIMSGMTLDPEQATGSFAYRRANLQDGDHRVTELRRKIEASGRPLREFSSLENLGDLVFSDLLGAIEKHIPDAAAETPLDTERRLHEAFASSRRKAYIARQSYFQALQEFIHGDGPPLVVHGPSGAGKSALMAYFTAYQRRTNPHLFSITHFVGASPSGSDALSVMRHIMGELRERFEIADEVPETREEMELLLPAWLARSSDPGKDERILIVIDAINQLPHPDNLLRWLPDYLLPNVRLIVTTTPGPVLEDLRAHAHLKWQELTIASLDAAEREALIVRFLGEYHKGLNTKQLHRLARDPKAASPLFLRTLLDELRVSGEHDLLDQMIEHYLRARDTDELFQLVLERMENDYGRDLVADTLSFIAQSRHGLSDSELLSVTHTDRVRLSILLLALDYHLMKPNGRYTFFHDYLRNAVQRRYLAHPSIARERSRSLARYFAAQPLSRRRVEEEPWQWQMAGDELELKRLLADEDFTLYYANDESKWDYLRMWRQLDENGFGRELENAALAGWRHRDRFEESDARVILKFAELLFDAGQFAHAESLVTSYLGAQREDALPDTVRFSLLETLTKTYQATSELSKAEASLRELLVLAERAFGPKAQQTVIALDGLGSLAYARGDYQEAVECFERAVGIAHGSIEPLSQRKLTSLQTNLGASYYGSKSFERARSQFESALDLMRRSALDRGSEAFALLNNLGALSLKLGDLDKAKRYLKESLDLAHLIYGPRHLDTIRGVMNLGGVLAAAGHLDEAKQHYDQALDAARKYLEPDNLVVSDVLMNLATMHYDSADLATARIEVLEVLRIRRSKLPANSRPVALAEELLAKIDRLSSG